MHAAADWLERAVDNGEFTLAEQLAQLQMRVALLEAGPTELSTVQVVAATRLKTSPRSSGGTRTVTVMTTPASPPSPAAASSPSCRGENCCRPSVSRPGR
ncbi:hypothetical protein [Streptomyces sp. NPDC004546]|uniref:hypothetical protein n=1 Tax=Streptomyces sp. NPDC004546 TaxID=3154282 RepID=UPI0033AD0D9C